MKLPSKIRAAISRVRAVKRKSLLELTALGCMVLALVGASSFVPWEWWSFAVLAGMFFIAANLSGLRSFSIGPGGIQAETRETADSPNLDTRETWKERDRLELYVIANLSVGQKPDNPDLSHEPQLSRLRHLKDAARDGRLPYQGDTPNMYATVQLNDFVTYAEGSNIDEFKKLATEWSEAHPERAQVDARDEARLRLARLRTAGVLLRNRQLSLEEVTEWMSQVQDWEQAVVAGIENIDPADAEWFRTLDAVPPPRISFVELSPEYSKTFRELDFMLVKLERLMVKYSAVPDSGENA